MKTKRTIKPIALACFSKEIDHAGVVILAGLNTELAYHGAKVYPSFIYKPALAAS